MRTGELRDREDFEGILVRTLQRGWSHWYAQPVHVVRGSSGEGQRWFEHPLLSVICTATPSAAVRRYIARSFRYTSVTWRAPAQWVLATVLASAPALRFRGRPLLEVLPGLPDGDDVLVLPGNQRVRCLDFKRGVSRVFLKEGFGAEAVHREAKIRGPGCEGPFFTMTAVDPEGRWFEEPLIEGFCLARCPPWWSRRRLEATALGKLAAWLERTVKDVDAESYLTQLRAQIHDGLLDLENRFGVEVVEGVDGHVDALSTVVSQTGTVRTAEGHGDLQPGNVLVASSDGAVHLIDWEYSARRSWHYDVLVWCLSARSALGLAGRIRPLLAGRFPASVASWFEGLNHVSERRVVVAWFLLEEVARALDEATSGDYRVPPEGWRLLRATLDEMTDEVSAR